MKRNTPKPVVPSDGKQQHHGNNSAPRHPSKPAYVPWAELLGQK
jgi:hypothetical protein